MRLGPLEIVIILAVVLVIFGATKMTDVGKRIGGGGKGKSGGRAGSETKAAPIRHPRLQMTGIFIVVAGAIMLAISYGLFKLVGAVGIWAVVLIAVGVTMVIISRRR